MPLVQNHTTARRRKLLGALLVVCLLGALAIAAAPSPGAGSKVVVLGATKTTPAAACPGSPCEAIGSVTGYQTVAGSTKKPFEVPFNGHLVAWSLAMSKPKASQQSFFNDFYNSPPEARISILKQVGTDNPPKFKLLRQGPVTVLTPFLGQTVNFALNDPLVVRQGNVIAITIPTWAPAFAVGLSDQSSWRASRAAGKCTKTADIKLSRPQQKVGGQKQYGCFYKTARLLYNAYIVRG